MKPNNYNNKSRPRIMNNRPQNNNGRKITGNSNRSYESNCIDTKVRGTSPQIFEKYQQLARDAQLSGDRIAAENYLQHAEHYYRMMLANNLIAQKNNQNSNDVNNNEGGAVIDEQALATNIAEIAEIAIDNSPDNIA